MTTFVDINRRTLPKRAPTNNVELSYELGTPFKTRDVSLTTSLTYINGLNYDVHVTDRMGLTKKIPSAIKKEVSSTTNFEVYLTHQYCFGVNFDPYGILNDSNISENKSLQLIKAEIIRLSEGLSPRQRAAGIFKVTLKYVVSEELMRLNGGDLYLQDIDVAVRSATIDTDKIPTHPESVEGRMLRNVSNSKGFNLNIYINDPDGKFGTRYINVLGNVYRVPAISDPSQQEGIHCYDSSPASIDCAGAPVSKRIIAFTDDVGIEPFYRDQHSAKVLGDPSAALKRELEEIKHINARALADREAAINELKHEREEAKLKREAVEEQRKAMVEQHKAAEDEKERLRKEIADDLKARRDMQSTVLADEQATRSRILAEDKYQQERSKTQSNAILDVLKWIPAAIGAIATLVIAMVKLFPSS